MKKSNYLPTNVFKKLRTYRTGTASPRRHRLILRLFFQKNVLFFYYKYWLIFFNALRISKYQAFFFYLIHNKFSLINWFYVLKPKYYLLYFIDADLYKNRFNLFNMLAAQTTCINTIYEPFSTETKVLLDVVNVFYEKQHVLEKTELKLFHKNTYNYIKSYNQIFASLLILSVYNTFNNNFF